MKICKVKNCNRKYYAKGYCSKHYQQFLLHKKILKRTKYKPNEIICNNNICEIILYNIKYEIVAKAIIDKDDLEKIKKYKWSLSHEYVCAKKQSLWLHHLILGSPPENKEIDHINHNTLDNRKSNLRFVTRSQNQMNQKNVKGYYWNKREKKWRAYITINKKQINLGYFTNKQSAIKARQNAEKKYFDEFAYKN